MTVKKTPSPPAAKPAASINPHGLPKLAKAFNEWQRQAAVNPAAFERDFESAAQFQRDLLEGHEPSYGERAASFLASLLAKIPD